MRPVLLSMLCGALGVACGGDANPVGGASGAAGASTSAGGSAIAGSSGSGAGTVGGAGSANAAGASGLAGAAAGSGGGNNANSGSGGAAGGSDGGVSAGGSAGAAGASSSGGASSATKLFDGMSLDGWTEYPAGNWKVVDGIMKATGKGRGFIATNADYAHYRILFSVKPGGTGGHAPCVLQFCTHPPPTLDACGGIQFQPPKGGTWDYRPGHNDSGGNLFTHVGTPGPAEPDGFYRCEVIANAATGEAKLACGGKDVLHFKDATAGKKGPWAIQTHNSGISDEYKDISVEEGIASDEYVTVKP